ASAARERARGGDRAARGRGGRGRPAVPPARGPHRSRPVRVCVLTAVVLAGSCGVTARTAAASGCAGASASTAYAARVAAALRSGHDVWGEQLLAQRNGPTVAKARSFLRPLLWARGPHGRPLTATGVYYLPFAEPDARG